MAMILSLINIDVAHIAQSILSVGVGYPGAVYHRLQILLKIPINSLRSGSAIYGRFDLP
jgi:hypothetical protein